MYNKVDKNIIIQLEKIVGIKNIIVDQEKMTDYSHDEFSLDEIARNPDVVVKPVSTDEIAEICRLANTKRIPVTPRAGATGLCGGCVPVYQNYKPNKSPFQD